MSCRLKAHAARPPLAVHAVACGKADQLMRVCARRCFGDLPQVALAHIAQRVRLEYPPSIGFFDLLRQLVAHILRCDDAELEEILALRMRATSCLDEYMDDPDIDMLIEDTDRKDLEEFRTKTSKHRATQSEFAASLKKFRESRRNDPQSGKRQAGHKKANTEKRTPVNIPAGDGITISMAESMLPPDWKLQHDQFNARWRVCDVIGEHAARSRSWGLYGYKNSFLLCCQYAWECAMSSKELECWVPGLFDEPVAGVGLGATSSSSS